MSWYVIVWVSLHNGWVDMWLCELAYTMDANEAQDEYEEVQTELRKKEEEVDCIVDIHGATETQNV